MQDFQDMQELDDQDLETVVGGANPAFTTADVNVGSSFLPGPSTYASATATATGGRHNLTYGHTQSTTVNNVGGLSFSFASGVAFAVAY